MNIQISMEPWEDAEHDAPEVCRTAGSLKITAGDQCLTTNLNAWSQTVVPTTRVSAYPLALWLAASWWRLRWEPLPSVNQASVSWRMAHELPAAGYGFLWPKVVFAGDGETMQIWSVSTDANSEQPVRYLADGYQAVPMSSFVEAVDSFLDQVLERLRAVGLDASDLRGLWSEVRSERIDDQAAHYRQIEAMLGFDPDDLCADVVESFIALGAVTGSSALGEITTACSSDNPMRQLSRIREVVAMGGITGEFAPLKRAVKVANHPQQPPWIRGGQLARDVRGVIGIESAAISDKDLAGLAEITPTQMYDRCSSSQRLPVGVAVRAEDSDELNIVLRRRNPRGRRFELARLLCDYLIADTQDNWFPATDTKTLRQKWQRAFAAEFLCPIDALKARLEDDFSDDALDEAAEHFGVSERTVSSQLVNHGLLPADSLNGGLASGKYPYVI